MNRPKTFDELQALMDAFHQTPAATKSEAELARIEGVKRLLKSKKRPKEVVEKIAATHRGKKNPKKGIRYSTHNAQAGIPKPKNGKPIHTPDGEFESVAAALRYYGKGPTNSVWIKRRMKNDPDNWHWVENK